MRFNFKIKYPYNMYVPDLSSTYIYLKNFQLICFIMNQWIHCDVRKDLSQDINSTFNDQ